MNIIDAIRGFFLYLVSLFGGEEQEARLDPSELIEALITCADRHAKRWDKKVDLPNYYEVRLSRIDWETYYGIQVAKTEERLSLALKEYAAKIDASMEEPKVVVMVDTNLPSGRVSVSVAFTAPAVPTGSDATPRCDQRGRRGHTPNASGADPAVTPVFNMWAQGHASSDARAEVSTPVPDTAVLHRTRGDAAASVTPQSVRPSASVCVPDGPSFNVYDGSTIGVRRDVHRELPAIVLPHTESVKTCSQVQGVFNKDDEGWFFTDMGRNGTCVRRGSEMTWLGVVPYALQDGDVLFFGDAEVPAVVFHTKVA